MSGAHDIVIVGGGAAGAVLAARLSEDPRRSVLLLEAGADYGTVDALPPELRVLGLDTRAHDWCYTTSASGRPARAVVLPRGRVLGGSSAINMATALRGHRADFDEWAALGNSGWSFDDVLPSFRALEHDLAFTDEWHGSDGPVPIARTAIEDQRAAQRAFVSAALARGHALEHDMNAPTAIGVGPMPFNAVDGLRQSTFVTYLARARGRANLTIRSRTVVDSLVLDGHRAIGVRLVGGEVVPGGQIVLAAGAYSSPLLLSRSGVGPAATLRAHDIPVVVDAKCVGANLFDHPRCMMLFAARTSAPRRSPQSVLTMRSPFARTPSPDVQLFFAERDDAYVFMIGIVKPSSVGHVALSSRDPLAMPYIDHSYLDTPDDRERLAWVIDETRALAADPALAALLGAESMPGLAVHGVDALTDAYVGSVATYFHPVGSCRMGIDEHAVVDPRLAVRGLEGAYVVDTSIMPTIPSANTNLAAMMVGEHAARLLR